MGSTFERLRKAEAVFRGLSKNFHKSKKDKQSGLNRPMISSELEVAEDHTTIIDQKLDGLLRKAGMTFEQIEQKSLRELKTALVLINAYIKKPDSYLGLDLDDYQAKDELEIHIRDTLIERKKLLLERFSALINSKKIEQIIFILNTMEDTATKSAIKKKLLQIAIKDQFVQKELRSLDKKDILELR